MNYMFKLMKGNNSINALSLSLLLLLLINSLSLFAQDNLNIPNLSNNLDLSSYRSVVGEQGEGWFWRYGFINDGNGPIFYIPRCSVPEGSKVLDFDADIPGQFPSFSVDPQIYGIFQKTALAPNGTITPPNLLKLDSSVVSGSYNVISFNDTQKYMGLYLGALSPDQTITLVAINRSGNVIAADQIVNPSKHVSTCILVQAPEDESIAAIVVRGGSDMYVDRIFYSSEIELSDPVTASRGRIDVLQPIMNEEVRTNIRLLSVGKITVPKGLDIDSVIASYPNWDNSQTITREVHFSKLRDNDDESIYVFHLSGIYVPEGESDISITATGPGVIASNFVRVIGQGIAPIPTEEVAGRVDIEPITIEVTQAIRGRVPFIEPGTTINEDDETVLVHNKATVVRGYGHLVFPDGETYTGSVPITARLTGSRNGAALPGSPLAPRNITTNMFALGNRATAFHRAKQENGRSWIFELPDSWTDVGSIDLRLSVNPFGSAHFVTEHPIASALANTIGLNNVEFREQRNPEVIVWLVDYYFRCSELDAAGDRQFRNNEGTTRTESSISACRGLAPGTVVNTKPDVFDAAESVLAWWNMAPFPQNFPDVFEFYDYVYVQPEDPSIPETEVSTPMLSEGSPANTDTLGVAFRSNLIVGTDGLGTMNVLMSDFVRGKAWGSPSFFRTTTNYTTLGHEAAHTMGLRHTGNKHDESWWIVRWLDDHGEIGKNTSLVSMFDVRRMNALPYVATRGQRDNLRHDYMSYGLNRWTSWDVWLHVEDAVGSNIARVDNRVDEHVAAFFAELFGFGQPPPNNEIVTINGYFENEKLKLAHAFHRANSMPIKFGDIEIIVSDDDTGESFKSHGQIQEIFESGTQDSINNRGFLGYAYVPEGSDNLIINYKHKEIYRQKIIPAPKITSLNVPDFWAESEKIEISWSATELPNNTSSKPQYLLQLSQDLNTWYDLAQTSETSLRLDTNSMPFSGKQWFVRLQSSSGIATQISELKEIEFPVRFVKPKIIHPRPNSKVAANDFITVHAAGSKFAVGSKELEWWINGEHIANGTSAKLSTGKAGLLDLRLLSPQTGLSDSMSIVVFKDDDLDGMPNDWEIEYGLNPVDPSDKGSDDDQDGLIAMDEYLSGSLPDKLDTDNDNYSDYVEHQVGSDPNDAESTPNVLFNGSPAPRINSANENEDETVNYTFYLWLLACLLVVLILRFLVRRSKHKT